MVRSLFKSSLSAMGIYSSRRTNCEDLRNLIGRLRPLDCGRDLIRIGGKGDGGYLIPDDLEGIEYCFSPGVSNVTTFENELASIGIKSFLADHSVDRPAELRPELCFDKKYIGASNRGNFVTLASWKEKYLKDYRGDLLLQMDIESYEYEVIFNLPDALLDQFRIMAIEFHGLDRLLDSFSFSILSSCFDKILQYFHVVHLHPNNCGDYVRCEDLVIPKLLEITFLNKRRVQSCRPALEFPHRMDADNIAGPSLSLPRC